MAESFEERWNGEIAGRNDQDGFADEGIEANQLESGECGHDSAEKAVTFPTLDKATKAVKLFFVEKLVYA